jgi:hypothetical protein
MPTKKPPFGANLSEILYIFVAFLFYYCILATNVLLFTIKFDMLYQEY